MGKQKGIFSPGKYGHDLRWHVKGVRGKEEPYSRSNHAPYGKACARNPTSANPAILTEIG